MAQEYKSWPVAVLVAIDQLGNAIAGGNPDAKRAKGYWKGLEKIIDFSFYPVDGPRHCYQAWQADKDELFKRGSDFTRVLLSVFIIIACPVIAIVLNVLVLFIRPWRYR
jgi:hypothetical protein